MKLDLSVFEKYPSLRFIGVLLAIENLNTAFSWLTDRPLTWILPNDSFRICWPFIPRCEFFSWPYSVTISLLVLYVLCAVLALGSWLLKKERAGFILLGSALAIRLLIVLQDYRLAENTHYIAGLLFFIFAFSRNRFRDIPFALFILSLSFGFLRLGADWSLQISKLPEAIIWNRLGTLYIIFVEVFLAVLYFSKRKNLFQALIFQQFLVVGLLWQSLGFHNAVSALLFIGLAPLVREAQCPTWDLSDFIQYLKKTEIRIALFIFLALQLPQWYLPGPTEMTGQGKPLALYIPSEKIECEPHITVWRSDFKKDEVPLHVPWIQAHLKCDPYVYIQMAKKMCSWLENRNDILQTDLYVPSRYRDRADWVPIVRERDICRQSYFYSMFLTNSWIR